MSRPARLAFLAGAVALVIAAPLRLVGLDAAPPGLHADEAHNLLDAVAIARTGASSRGEPWPLSFDHFGHDRVEGFYVYAVAAITPADGEVRPATVRVPAAFAGILGVAAIGLLAGWLLGWRAGAIAALLAAVEPWHVHYARLGLRGAFVVPLVALGLALAVRALRLGVVAEPDAADVDAETDGPIDAEKNALATAPLLGAAAALGLAALVYAPMRVSAPLLATVAAIVGWPALRSRPRAAVGALAVLAALLIPAFAFGLSDDGWRRFRAISVIDPDASIVSALGGFVVGWIRHASPRMLFLNTSSRGFWAEGAGLLSPLEAVALAIGLIVLARAAFGPRPTSEVSGDRGRPAARLILGGLLVAPVAAAMTRPTPDPLRAIAMAPLATIVIAAGVDAVIRLVERRARPALAVAIVAIPLAASAAFGLVAWSSALAGSRPFWRADLSAAVAAAERAVGEDGEIAVSGAIALAMPQVALAAEVAPETIARAHRDAAFATAHFEERGRVGRWRFVGRPLGALDDDLDGAAAVIGHADEEGAPSIAGWELVERVGRFAVWRRR